MIIKKNPAAVVCAYCYWLLNQRMYLVSGQNGTGTKTAFLQKSHWGRVVLNLLPASQWKRLFTRATVSVNVQVSLIPALSSYHTIIWALLAGSGRMWVSSGMCCYIWDGSVATLSSFFWINQEVNVQSQRDFQRQKVKLGVWLLLTLNGC